MELKKKKLFYQQCLHSVFEFAVHRLEHYFSIRKDEPKVSDFKIKTKKGHVFSDFIKKEKLKPEEQLILCLCLIPRLDPQFFTNLINPFLPQGGDLPIFGGVKGKNHRGVLPTGETLLFFLAGNRIDERIKAEKNIKNSQLLKNRIVLTDLPPTDEPWMSAKFSLAPDYVEYFLTGKMGLPAFGPEFPAQKLETGMEWEDLVLTEKVREQIEELKTWVEHHHTLMYKWGMHKKLVPGYRALFYGPPGTRKTLTASLLGKYTGWPVFRVNLSSIVSKYIGETEKNLEKLFEKAQRKNWILFFDEADALFGKRTGVNDSHDRYANQEVSYLLQRLENFEGLVILSTNFKSNMDEAFLRRFNAAIRYSLPDSEQRQQIWENLFPADIPLCKEVDLKQISLTYELTGGNIINAVNRACLQTIKENSSEIGLEAILTGIKREIEKEGKVFTPFINSSVNGQTN